MIESLPIKPIPRYAPRSKPIPPYAPKLKPTPVDKNYHVPFLELPPSVADKVSLGKQFAKLIVPTSGPWSRNRYATVVSH